MPLEIHAVSKRYGRIAAVDDCHLTVGNGELVALLGPSGCGKTTLLRIIAGLLPFDEGTVVLNGRRLDGLPPANRRVAFVMEHLALYPHMTAGENMMFPLAVRKVPREQAEARVRAIAGTVAILDLLDRYPSELSGGQKQRVALGRALVRNDAELLLADEPFSDLDAQLRYQFRPEFKRLQRERSLPCLFVTHDQEEALAIGDRVAVMNRGKIVQVGSAHDLYQEPSNLFVARFIGKPPMNILDGQLIAGELHSAFGVQQAPPSLRSRSDQPVAIGVRAEELTLTSEGPGVSGQVVLTEHTGPDSFVYLEVNGKQLVVRQPAARMVSLNDHLLVRPPAMWTRVFDSKTGVRFT